MQKSDEVSRKCTSEMLPELRLQDLLHRYLSRGVTSCAFGAKLRPEKWQKTVCQEVAAIIAPDKKGPPHQDYMGLRHIQWRGYKQTDLESAKPALRMIFR